VKFAADRLAAHLTKTLAPVYLIAGDEPLIVAEALDAIRTAARREGFEQRDLCVVERGFKWDELLAGADNLSLFATRRIVELRLATPRPGDAGAKAIRAMIDRPDSDRLLLIATSKLDASASKSVWVKTIEKSGVVVQVWPVKRSDLPRWIHDRARRAQLKFSTSAAEVLAERVEGNLLAADQEIQKFSLLAPAGTIDEAMVLAAVANNFRFDVFRLTDALLAGDLRRSLAVLASLRAEGSEPALISWALSRELCLLTRLKSAALRGDNEAQIFSKLRVWPQRQALVKRALERYRFTQLTALLSQCAETDRIIKGVDRGQPWIELTNLVMAALAPTNANNSRAA
jgi:DNA polymerase III subunit delta